MRKEWTSAELNLLKNRVEKALVYIDWEMLDMGDSYVDMASYLCDYADMKLDEEKDLFEQAEVAYKYLAEVKPDTLLAVLEYTLSEENMSYLKMQLPYCKEVTPEENPIVVSLQTVYDFVLSLAERGINNKEVSSKLECIVSEFKNSDLCAMRIGYLFGHWYFQYLEPAFYGVTSNCCFRVGRALTGEDEYCEIPDGYVYGAHAEYNGIGLPHNGYGIFFKRGENKEVEAHLYHYECDNKFHRLYTDLSMSFPVSLEDVEEKSRIIAGKLNELAKKELEGGF